MSNAGMALSAKITTTNSILTAANRRDHFLARWSWRRMKHRVEPGLYALGKPTTDSPVFVTANYSLSFDALRSSLLGVNGYILVLDTDGVNVWCAAGKGTFGTKELIKQIENTQLKDVVKHRTVILPQLGAPGVVAHEVKQRTGFKVEYGPVRAKDLAAYLQTHKATPEMRRVRFTLADRVPLIPVDLIGTLPVIIVVAIALYFWPDGIWASAGAVASMLAGVVLFPILLPWLPSRDFSLKGFTLGAVVALLMFLIKALVQEIDIFTWRQLGNLLGLILVWSPVTAFLSLNFTGASTFTSRTGVRQEMNRYIRLMAISLVTGITASVLLAIF
jgi:hypothetical protein